MQLQEEGARVTLARRLGDVTHLSPLWRRVLSLSGCSEEDIGRWLLKCAVTRGASHYRRDFPANLPADDPALTNEELGIALCLGHNQFDPTLIRAAAQLLSSPGTDVETVCWLAEAERVEPVLLHIAEAAARTAPNQQPWASLRSRLRRRHRVRTEPLPHWSRFVSQTGFTPEGKKEHIEWLRRSE